MSETKFTPGEWHINFARVGGKDDRIIYSDYANTTYIAEICIPGERVAEAKANAHLIAAAPDLYAALESLRALLGPESDFAIHRIDGQSINLAEGVNIEHVIERASKALAKARGEA